MQEAISPFWTAIVSVWVWYWKLPTDAKIQFWVLFTLVLTLIVAMLFEFLKLRKDIKFLTFQTLESDTPLTIRIEFSNDCRRVIIISSFYAVSVIGLKSHDYKYSIVLQEAEAGSARTLFSKRINIYDVYSLVLTDSVNKPYITYLYKVRITSKWVARFHWFRNSLWTRIKSYYPAKG